MPNRSIGWAPKITPDDFHAAFTSAESWGTLSQRRQGNRQTNALSVKWGRLPVATLTFELPKDARLTSAAVTVDGKPVAAKATQEGRRVTITLEAPGTVAKDAALEVTMTT